MKELRRYILESPDHPLERRAVEIMGETETPESAGYILSDGTLLDFSGQRWGGWGKDRQMDHREINKIAYDPETDKYFPKFKTDMISFQKKTGAIRMSFHPGNNAFFDMEKKPTYSQKRKMKEIVEDQDYFNIDVDYRKKHYEFNDVWEFIEWLERR